MEAPEVNGDTNPALTDPLPPFVTLPGGTDWLLILVIVLAVLTVLFIGTLYLRLHSMPERLAHRRNKLQLELVAVLALISLFTHNHLFWIAGLLLAFVRFPDFGGFFGRMTAALEKIAGIDPPIQDAAEESAGAPAQAPETARPAAEA